jgi:hypothetical protein
MKVFHFLCIGLVLIGGLYVFHMVTQHQGSQILPGIGVNQKLP